MSRRVREGGGGPAASRQHLGINTPWDLLAGQDAPGKGCSRWLAGAVAGRPYLRLTEVG